LIAPPSSSLTDDGRVGFVLLTTATRENAVSKFSEKSARVVEETAFAAYCLCVTSTSAVLTKKWGSHDHR